MGGEPCCDHRAGESGAASALHIAHGNDAVGQAPERQAHLLRIRSAIDADDGEGNALSTLRV